MSAPLYNITKNNNLSQSLLILGAVRYGSEEEEGRDTDTRMNLPVLPFVSTFVSL